MATMAEIWFNYLEDIGSNPAEKDVSYAGINNSSGSQMQQELKELEEIYHTKREELMNAALHCAEEGCFCTAIATNYALQLLMLDYAQKRDKIHGI